MLREENSFKHQCLDDPAPPPPAPAPFCPSNVPNIPIPPYRGTSANVICPPSADTNFSQNTSSRKHCPPLSEDTTVHLPLLLPPPTVPDTSLHTNDHSPTYVSDLRVQPMCPTYVSDLRVRPTWLAYVSTLRVQLSDHIIILIIYLR